MKVFELKELRAATNDFSRLLKIGEGGFGGVYKGFIKPAHGMGERITVAVKILNQHGLQVLFTFQVSLALHLLQKVKIVGY